MPRELQLAGPRDTGYGFVDVFSAAHLEVGFMFGVFGARPGTALAVSLIWEGIEPTLKYFTPGPFPSNKVDRPINKLGDTAFFMAGWAGGHALQKRRRR